jgi:nicotinamide-nucleotide amidase
MNVEIISIGDELLIGQTINTNSSWMGEQLSLIGASVYQISAITDDESHILETLERASEKVNVVLITGGLGPTKDDITKHTLCKFFGSELLFNKEVFSKLETFFSSRGLEMLDVNKDQAMLPTNALVLENTRGTASGMWFEKDDVIYVSMPGVPYEMKGIMRDHVLPRLRKDYIKNTVVHRTVKTIGIGESFLAEKIELWENSLIKVNIKLAYLPSPGIVKLRLSGYGEDESKILASISNKINDLTAIVGDYIYGYEKEELNQLVGDLLLESAKTLSTAESCTGGYIAHLITSVPGSSAYFKGSLIAYNNEVKVAQLRVKQTDINRNGAVSKEVVEQMAIGAIAELETDYSIATSGILGPDGGSDEKPVGTIWIAVASGSGVISEKICLGKSRSRNAKITALRSLNMLRKYIWSQEKIVL